MDQAGRKQQKLCTAQPIKHNLVIKIFCLVTVELNNLAGTGCLVEFGARYEQLTVIPSIVYDIDPNDCCTGGLMDHIKVI